MHTYNFEITHPGEMGAGIRPYTESVTVIVGDDPGGDDNNPFEKFMTESLMQWFDGAFVRCSSMVTSDESMRRAAQHLIVSIAACTKKDPAVGLGVQEWLSNPMTDNSQFLDMLVRKEILTEEQRAIAWIEDGAREAGLCLVMFRGSWTCISLKSDGSFEIQG